MHEQCPHQPLDLAPGDALLWTRLEHDSEQKRPVVLAVDDETDNAELVRRALQLRTDALTLTAFSGSEALAVLRAQHVDVLVLDFRMPGMSGVELLERVSFLGHKPPAIMLTAYPEDPAVVDAQKRGLVHCVISKPWNTDDLLLAIDFALKMRPR